MDKIKETIDNLSLTNDEAKRLSEAFKKEEFRKLFMDYAKELQDPENKRLYEEELTALENERGMDVEFINPIAGHVLKTIQNGDKKVFINICHNEKIQAATSQVSNKNKSIGTNWSIPHSFTSPREDVDKKKESCLIYDVVFNSETYEMSEKNLRFRKVLQDTALDGVEKTFKVKLDKINYKILKMKMKGPPVATVIRRKREDFDRKQDELTTSDDPLKFPYPYPAEETTESRYTVNEESKLNNDDGGGERKGNENLYTKPDYKIKYSNNFNILNYVGDHTQYQMRPDQIIVEIKLPLLSSANALDLDISRLNLKLSSERPVKYLLEIKLVYPIMPDNGSAKFDKSKRILNLTLPIEPSKSITSDSGDTNIDCDNKELDNKLIGEVEKEENVESVENEISCENDSEESVTHLEIERIHRTLPQINPKFRFNSEYIFILVEVRNVLESTFKVQLDKNIINNRPSDIYQYTTIPTWLIFDNTGQGGWINHYHIPVEILIQDATETEMKEQLDGFWTSFNESVAWFVNMENIVIRIPRRVEFCNNSLIIEGVEVMNKKYCPNVTNRKLTSICETLEERISVENERDVQNNCTSSNSRSTEEDVDSVKDEIDFLYDISTQLTDEENIRLAIYPHGFEDEGLENKECDDGSSKDADNDNYDNDDDAGMGTNCNEDDVLDITSNECPTNIISQPTLNSSGNQSDQSNKEDVTKENSSDTDVKIDQSSNKTEIEDSKDNNTLSGVIPSDFYSELRDPAHRTKSIELSCELLFDLE